MTQMSKRRLVKRIIKRKRLSNDTAMWTQEQTNQNQTWTINTTSTHSGSYFANVVYDPALIDQDEILLIDGNDCGRILIRPGFLMIGNRYDRHFAQFGCVGFAFNVGNAGIKARLGKGALVHGVLLPLIRHASPASNESC